MSEKIIEILDREELKVASLTKRIISMTVDDFLISFLIVIAFYDQFKMVKSYEEMIILTDKLFFFIFLAYTLYHWLFIALYGKTLGKMIVKIRCIDVNTLDNPSLFKALIRSIVRNFDEMFFYLGMLYAVVDPLNRAFHDLISGCVVIEEKE